MRWAILAAGFTELKRDSRRFSRWATSCALRKHSTSTPTILFPEDDAVRAKRTGLTPQRGFRAHARGCLGRGTEEAPCASLSGPIELSPEASHAEGHAGE